MAAHRYSPAAPLLIAMRHSLSIAFASLLAVAGCYVPASRQYQPTGKQRPDALVGDVTSSKPIQLGRTTLADALPVLREAINGSAQAPPVDLDDRFTLRADDRAIAVNFAILTGQWVAIDGHRTTGASRWLVLELDEAKTIASAQTLDQPPTAQPFHPFAYADSDRLFDAATVRTLQTSGTLMSVAQRNVIRSGGERRLRQQMEMLRLELEAQHAATTQMTAEATTQPATQPSPAAEGTNLRD